MSYEALTSRLREIGTLHSVQRLLGWDQEVMMPPAAARFRGEEIALLASLVHEKATDPALGDLIEAAEDALRNEEDELRSANLREIRRDYEKARKLPRELVAELSLAGSEGLEAWREARKSNDFPGFLPFLERLLDLSRRKAEHLAPSSDADLYDALLDEYEPGMTGGRVETLFRPLREALVPLIARLADSEHPPPNTVHELRIPVPEQVRFSRRVAGRLGYDFQAGRLDTSTHPFTEGLGPGDTRITSRYQDHHFADALGSTMHEAGHALYEQGLPKEEYPGQPLSEAAGLGIHESQSRMWENQVGRSREFWVWALPVAVEILGEALAPFTVDEIYRAMNRVEPSLIRVEADEATYNLHIMLRFDLERALIAGDLLPADLPAAWNERMRSDLGVDPPDDARGCLQDIHWSMGAFGYFPTYTLGNLYAAQIWETILQDLPDLPSEMSRGEFGGLLAWLREKIHRHGRRWPAAELCRKVTGRPLDFEPLVKYLEGKLAPIYGVK